MNKKAVLINQVTGPLFIDIVNQYIKEYDDVVLITGSIEEFEVVDSGSGYSRTPRLFVSGGGGQGAALWVERP